MIVYRRCKQYLALQPSERALLLRAFVSLAVMEALLRVAGYQRVVRWTGRRGSARYQDAAALARARELAHWIAVAARHHLVPARCLARSLVLHRWLWQEGLPGDLRIGVRKEHGAIRAHAWVEYHGHVINDQEAAVLQFVPLTGLSASSSAADAVLERSRHERLRGTKLGGVRWS